MTGKALFAILGTVAVLTGCQTTQQVIAASQPQAVSVATRRAQFEMNCPSAAGQVLSSEQVPPVLQYRGTYRLEYTIGVAGCNQRATYLVICPEDGSGCFAAGARNEIR